MATADRRSVTASAESADAGIVYFHNWVNL
jgi:hypothetical protein